MDLNVIPIVEPDLAQRVDLDVLSMNHQHNGVSHV
jgi:hypothetical protein